MTKLICKSNPSWTQVDPSGAPGKGETSMSFENKTAVVTGAGGGMGYAIALALDERGTAVTGVDIKDRPAGLPESCSYLQADITEPGVPARAVEIASEDGRLDFHVNGAGVGWFGKDRSIVDTPEEIWEQVMAIN